MKPLDPRLLRDHGTIRPLVAVAGARALLDAVLLVALALVLAGAFADVVAGEAATAGLATTAAVVLALTIAQALASWWATVVARRRAARAVAELRGQLVGRVVEDGRSVAPGEVAVLATRGVDAMQPYLADYVPQLVAAAMMPLLLLGTVLWLDPPSGLILLVALPLLPLFLALVGRFSQARAAASWASLEHLSAHLLDVITGLPTLKRFGRHRTQTATIAHLADRSRRTTMAALRTAFLSAFVLELATTLSVALVAVPLGLRLIGGTVELATAFAVLLLAPEVFAPIRRVGAAYHTATEGVAATDRILDVVHAPKPPRGAAAVPSSPSLRAVGIGVHRPGRNGLSPDRAGLEVSPGEIVALVGPNGAGKSTLLDVLRGAVVADEGTVAVNETPLEDIDPDAWAATVAWVPQRPLLVDDTVRANVALGAPSAPAAAVQAATAALGIAHLLDHRARTVSAGERQRVALARAVLRVEAGGAQLALLDEPTANLDADTEAAVVAVVHRLAAAGAAVVVVAHRPALVAVADRVVAVAGSATGEAGAPARTRPDRPGRPEPTATAPGPLSVTEARSGSLPTDAGLGDDGARRELPRGPWRWIRDEGQAVRSRLVATVLAGAGATVAGVALTAAAAWLLARASQQPEVLSLTTVVVLVRALALSKAGLRYVERLASHDTVLRLLGDVRVRLFDRLAVISPAGWAGARRGDLFARLAGDLDRLQDLWLRGLLPPVVAAVGAAATVAAATSVLPAAGGVLAGGLVLGGLAVPWLATRYQARVGSAAASERARLTEEVVDLAEAATELAAYGAGPTVLSQVADRDRRLHALERAETRVGGLADGAESVVRAATAGAVLIVAGAAAAGGTLDVLWVPALVLVGWALPEIVGGLPAAARRLGDLAPAARRITEVLDTPDPLPDPAAPVAAPTGTIGVSVRGLVVSWPGRGEPVLTGVDLDIAAGEVVLLTGASGSGKSTLAAALVGFVRPDAGSIRLGDVDAAALRGDDRRRLVGWCPQDNHLFDASPRDNLRIARPDASDDALRAALAAVGMDRWVATLPDGLDTPVGTRGSWLSGGQAQRLSLAQVLLADPPVVILDEPTANLDPDTARTLLADLLAATHNRTTLVITHDEDALGEHHRTVHLVDGRVVDRTGSRRPSHAGHLVANGLRWSASDRPATTRSAAEAPVADRPATTPVSAAAGRRLPAATSSTARDQKATSVAGGG